jgi:hypothetical protein
MHLAELGLDFARSWLQPDGAFLVKVFQGHGFNEFLHEMRKTFKTVSSRKPDASGSQPGSLSAGQGLENVRASAIYRLCFRPEH